MKYSSTKLKINLQLIPYLNDPVMAPWDKYEWYLDSECNLREKIFFKSKLLNANAAAGERRIAYLAADIDNLCGYELSLERYIGQGDILFPEINCTNQNRFYAYPPVYALQYEWKLAPGEEKELTQVFSLAQEGTENAYFDQEFYIKEKEERQAVFDKLFSKSQIQTGNSAFDYYVNYWIPLQMNWVASLDRGWPTGMRGSRDSAQDYAALLYTNPEACKNIILTMLECQRSDGWLPRQYSAKGKHGKHDLRGHVDGGAFFIEFMWKYCCPAN